MTQPQRPNANFSWQNGPMHLLHMSHTEDSTMIELVLVANEVTIMHNALIRAINSIYIQAPHVPISEHNNFVAYCLATYKGMLALETVWLKNIEQRTGDTGLARTYDASVTAWGNWIESTSQRKNNFSPDMCISMMDDFVPALQAFWNVKSMEIIGVPSRYPQLNISDMWAEEKRSLLGGLSKTKVLPVFLLNHDESSSGEFPEINGVRMWAAREVCARQNGEWWKFSTVGFGGEIREVRYVG
jgi:hypothetical protein